MNSLKAIKDACATLPVTAEKWPEELIDMLAQDEYTSFRARLYYGVVEWVAAAPEAREAFRKTAEARLKRISDFFDGKLNAKTP